MRSNQDQQNSTNGRIKIIQSMEILILNSIHFPAVKLNYLDLKAGGSDWQLSLISTKWNKLSRLDQIDNQRRAQDRTRKNLIPNWRRFIEHETATNIPPSPRVHSHLSPERLLLQPE